jgi:hypothetical protein
MPDKNDRREMSVEDAQQADDSPDTFYILIISLAALTIIGAALLWYFGVFHHLAAMMGRT